MARRRWARRWRHGRAPINSLFNNHGKGGYGRQDGWGYGASAAEQGPDHCQSPGASYRAGTGGSGGGIILAGNKVLVSGTLAAKGGNGGFGNDATRHGAGGGGGRIAIYANSLVTNGVTVAVSGGTATADGTAGMAGTFRYRGDGQGGDLSYPFGCVPGTIVLFR